MPVLRAYTNAEMIEPSLRWQRLTGEGPLLVLLRYAVRAAALPAQILTVWSGFSHGALGNPGLQVARKTCSPGSRESRALFGYWLLVAPRQQSRRRPQGRSRRHIRPSAVSSPVLWSPAVFSFPAFEVPAMGFAHPPAQAAQDLGVYFQALARSLPRRAERPGRDAREPSGTAFPVNEEPAAVVLPSERAPSIIRDQ